MICVHLKPELPSVLCVCVCVHDCKSSETHAPNVLSALANKAFKAFKVIVSCLTV